jgi:hypothetical protein
MVFSDIYGNAQSLLQITSKSLVALALLGKTYSVQSGTNKRGAKQRFFQEAVGPYY